MASKIIVDQLQTTSLALNALTLPASNATTGQYLQDNGSGALSWSTVVTGTTGGLAGVMVYTLGGNWNKATRNAATGVTITKVVVEVQGAGGSGSAQVTNYGGGAGGGFAKKLVDVSSVTASTISVGLAGAAIGAGGGVGNAGGISKWNDLVNVDVVGNGGAGRGASGDASGGAATGGDITTANNFFQNWNTIDVNTTSTFATSINAAIIGPITVTGSYEWTISGILNIL